jgi:uncharacterized membrane protein YraQ (UPF0718 family)
MELIAEFLYALIELSNAMAPYILFGLLFAGILHETVPETLVTRHLGKENVSSVEGQLSFGFLDLLLSPQEDLVCPCCGCRSDTQGC